jgi:hypothetical protein
MNITVDPSDNTLRFSFAVHTDSPRKSTLPATIDIGEQGRLLGIEMDIKTVTAPALRWPPESSDLVSFDTKGGTCYLAIEPEPESHAFVRSVRGEVRMVTDERGMAAEVILPRRGEGYEITYPSGNR